ncbi:MAG: hypothetical protein K2L73_04825 [Muribaculaceae bacterium]|nr:hypothetical protein [Muribaculaceae bacterium]
MVRKLVDGEDEPEFTLTAVAYEHVAMVVNCMNEGMHGIAEWKVGLVEITDNIVIDYIGKYCDEALKEIAKKANTEFWIDGNMVNLCRCEHSEPITMGYDKGLINIEPDKADNVKFYTRLYPMGSTRNIESEKYGHSRLQLPEGAKFVEVNADKYGRVDHYEKSAFADIFPRRIGEVTAVRTEERRGEDGALFTIYYFKDDGLTFDPNNYEIARKVKRVSFQEGSELTGLGAEEDGTYYFEVNFDSDNKEFEIITTWPYDNDMQLPGGHLIPKVGDHYILWNIRMPDEYYDLAEKELLEAVNKYNEDHALDVSVFKCTTDHIWIENSGEILSIGRRVKLESSEFFPETGYRDSRITKITRKVNLPSQMDIEIGDVLGRTAKQKFNDDIAESKSYVNSLFQSVNVPDIIRTGDKTTPTDYNLYSAKRSRREFISRVADDVAAGRITFQQGLEAIMQSTFHEGVQFGPAFAEGTTGFGGKIDRFGNAWLGGLWLRDFLEVPELRYNRTEISIGNTWRGPGGGVIESVVPDINEDGTTADTGTITLHLEDGEIGAIAVDDLCQGIFHDSINLSNNAPQDSDDGRGNFHFAGFCSVYFRVTGIVDKNRNLVFRYKLREKSERWKWQHHPSAQMHFAVFGNLNDPARQTSRYATRTYERYLVGVNGWEQSHAGYIAAQFGDLSNLSIYGINMQGYSAYLRNIYMTGHIEQLDVDLRMELEFDNDNYIAPGQSKRVKCRVMRGYEDVTDSVTSWRVVRNSDKVNDQLAWVAMDKVQNFNGEIEIAFDNLLDLTEDGTSFTFTATVDGKQATAELTLRRTPKDGTQGATGAGYTNNILQNSDFADSFNLWGGSGLSNGAVTIDPDMQLDGRNSVKVSAQGLTTNMWYGIQAHIDYDGPEVDMTFSVDTMIKDLSTLDSSVYAELRCLNSAGDRVQTYATSAKPSRENEWQRVAVTGKTVAGTKRVQVAVYVNRNGVLWFNGPKLEYGANTNTQWTPYAKGVTIASQSVMYSTNHGATQPADSTFTLSTVPTLEPGQYLWSKTTVTYTNGKSISAYSVSKIGADGPQGPQGIQGCIYRATQWMADTAYHNDIALNDDGMRYIDIVLIPNPALQTKAKAYICKQSHTSSGENAPGTDGGLQYWTEANSMAPIFTPLLLADNAVITLLQSNQVVVMKDDGSTVNVALGGGSYPLWIGDADPLKANFRVDALGKATLEESEVRGKVVSGDASGRRVELNPDDMSLLIYDENGVLVNSFKGESYAGPSALFGSGSLTGTVGMLTRAGNVNGGSSGTSYGQGSQTLNGTGNGTDVFMFPNGSTALPISTAIHSDTPIEVLLSGYLYTEAYAPNSGPGIPTAPIEPDTGDGNSGGGLTPVNPGIITGPVNIYNAAAQVSLHLETYSDAQLKNRVGAQLVATCREAKGGIELSQKRVKTTAGGYHVLTLVVSMSTTGISSQAIVKWGSAVSGKPNISGSYVTDTYMSRFFANGYCLGLSGRDYIMAYNQGSDKGMRFIMENNGYGVDISDAGIKHKHHNGGWMSMPLFVFKGIYEYTTTYGYRARSAATKSYDGQTPTATRQREGYVRLTFPASWQTAMPQLAEQFIVRVTGYGSVDNGPLKANIKELTSSYIDIMLSDDETLNDGGFMIDISLME